MCLEIPFYKQAHDGGNNDNEMGLMIGRPGIELYNQMQAQERNGTRITCGKEKMTV
jgi:hypothetical protein